MNGADGSQFGAVSALATRRSYRATAARGSVLLYKAAAFAALSYPSGPTGDRTSDACWKWGLIYFNPADPSILIEKRFGIGYAINLGNRWAWVVLALLLALCLLGLALSNME